MKWWSLFKNKHLNFLYLIRTGKPHLVHVLYLGDFGKVSHKWDLTLPPEKNFCEKVSPIGEIPVFTLIRTDTTLDLSQKAEKVWILSLLIAFMITKKNFYGYNIIINILIIYKLQKYISKRKVNYDQF